MTVEDFIQFVDGARRTSRGWVARCPAHPDKQPSLSIREGAEGRILLHDFAGCEPSAICTALGLRLSDLFPGSKVSPDEISWARRKREAMQAAEKARRHREGLAIDACREADNLIRSRTGLDISDWSNNRLDAELTALAAAYSALSGDPLNDR